MPDNVGDGQLQQELRLTRALTRAISWAPSSETALEETLRLVCAETGWELGQAWLVEGEPPRLRPSSAWYGGSEAARQLRRASEALSFPEGEGLPGQAWARGAPVWIEDFSSKDASPRAGSAVQAGLRSALAAPVPGSEGVVGVLEFLFANRREPDRGLLDAIATVTAQLGACLQGERAEETLRAELTRREFQLSEANRLGRLGGWEWDLVEGTMTWSKELLEIFGLDPREGVSPTREDFRAMVHAEDRPAIQAQVDKALKDAQPLAYLLRIVRPDGTQRLVQGRGRVELDELGRPRRLVGMTQDVTDIREHEAALERLSRRYELILEAAGEGIFGMDSEGRFTFLNQAGVAMLDWPAEELLGKDAHSTIHHTRPNGSPYPVSECPIVKAAQMEGKAIRTDCIFWRKDGTGFPVDYLATPISDDGDVTGAVVVFRDTSEEHEARREAEQLERRVRVSERMDTVGRLAGGIAHDFNNLLAVILNYATLVSDELREGDPRREDVEEIRRAAERAAALTEQLLLFSRQGPGRVESVDFDAVVRDVERLLRRTLGEHIALEVRLAGNLPALEADRGQLEQVLLNLAVNARDAMPEGGTLAIETQSGVRPDAASASAEVIRLVVRDSGKGMPPEVASRAFDPFFTTKPPGQGTGLGLASVYGVVTQAGGRLDLSSEPGEGTEVTVDFPAAPGPASGGLAGSGEDAKEPNGRGETVLVVEDEDAVRRVTVRILGDAGYQVLYEEDPLQALELLQGRDEPIDLLLTDVVMPGMSGTELADRISESHPETRVLFMSGYAADEAPHKDATQPGGRLVAKPFSRHDLLSAVARALG